MILSQDSLLHDERYFHHCQVRERCFLALSNGDPLSYTEASETIKKWCLHRSVVSMSRPYILLRQTYSRHLPISSSKIERTYLSKHRLILKAKSSGVHLSGGPCVTFVFQSLNPCRPWRFHVLVLFVHSNAVISVEEYKSASYWRPKNLFELLQ